MEVAEFMGEKISELKDDIDFILGVMLAYDAEQVFDMEEFKKYTSATITDSEFERLVNKMYEEFSAKFSLIYLEYDEEHTEEEIDKFLSKPNIKHFDETQWIENERTR